MDGFEVEVFGIYHLRCAPTLAARRLSWSGWQVFVGWVEGSGLLLFVGCGVVSSAEQLCVVEVGVSSVGPVGDVVGVAP